MVVIDSLPLMGRYFCKQILPFWLDNLDVQGRNEVRWRLGKETSLAPPCLNLRSFGSKCTVLKKVLMTLLWLFKPRSDSAPRELLAPSLRLWRYTIKIGKCSENNQISKSENHEIYSMNICNFRTQYGMDLAQTADKGYWSHFVFFRIFFVSLLILPRVFSGWTCVCFANNKTFPTFKKLLFWG